MRTTHLILPSLLLIAGCADYALMSDEGGRGAAESDY